MAESPGVGSHTGPIPLANAITVLASIRFGSCRTLLGCTHLRMEKAGHVWVPIKGNMERRHGVYQGAGTWTHRVCRPLKGPVASIRIWLATRLRTA